MNRNIEDNEYLHLMSGEEIYGDNFSQKEIEKWFYDEEHASFHLRKDAKPDEYIALNYIHAFSFLRGMRFANCLALGSGDGADITPLAEQVEQFTVIEPEKKWWRSKIGGVKAIYKKPQIDGRIDLPDCSIDLAVALSVLHHIPNITFVINELSRVLTPGGILVLREPIVSMGDWRFPRAGLTARERGIPQKPLLKAVSGAGFSNRRTKLCDCPIVVKCSKKIGIRYPYKHRFIVKLDSFISNILKWNVHYNPSNIFQKVSPASIFIVATKKKEL